MAPRLYGAFGGISRRSRRQRWPWRRSAASRPVCTALHCAAPYRPGKRKGETVHGPNMGSSWDMSCSSVAVGSRDWAAVTSDAMAVI